MSKWTFSPFVIRQYNLDIDLQNEGPSFGFRVVTCENERGLGLYLGWWYVGLTWVRSAEEWVYACPPDCVWCELEEMELEEAA